MNKKGVKIGIVLLIIIILGALYYRLYIRKTPVKKVKISGYISSGKEEFLANPGVLNILNKKYGISFKATKAGSIEMIKDKNFHNSDFLWPSSQVALDLFKMENSQLVNKSEVIFNSPIVLYSWDIITDKLIKLGVVEKIEGSYFIVDFPKLIKYINEKKSWSEIGLDHLYGKMSIVSTDPTKSNSGNMFSGLLANILNGDIVTTKTIDRVLYKVVNFYKTLGYLEYSSDNLFDQFLKKGAGALPIIVGYESQVIEFSIRNKDAWIKVKDKIRILYPVPTVWSSHPLIALNEDANQLIEALKDEEVQKLAWKSHGFRSGIIGINNAPEILNVAGIPETITKVIPMPSAEVMDKIIKALQK